MAAKLISLSFKPSNMLPQLAELKTFLESEFGRHMPGFTLLDTNLKWGEATISILGRDSAGSLVAVFPTVTTQERDFHEVISEGMVAEGWVEENRDEIQRHYGPKGVKAGTMLRMILVAPTVANRSRAVTRALERAGFEVLDYSIFEIDTADGPVRAISFDAKSAPASVAAAAAPMAAPPPPPPAPSTVSIAAAAPAAAAAPPPPPPRSEVKIEPPRQSPVEAFISSMADPNLKAMSEQILTFLLSRFPAAETVMSPGDRGFTLNVHAAHLATIRLDKTSLWLEVGPEKIPTNKIKDPATLERAMNLPSVLEALQSVQG